MANFHRPSGHFAVCIRSKYYDVHFWSVRLVGPMSLKTFRITTISWPDIVIHLARKAVFGVITASECLQCYVRSTASDATTLIRPHRAFGKFNELVQFAGIVWFRWRGWDYTLKRASMMIKPRGLQPNTWGCPRPLPLASMTPPDGMAQTRRGRWTTLSSAIFFDLIHNSRFEDFEDGAMSVLSSIGIPLFLITWIQ